jgi:hypothetical protein
MRKGNLKQNKKTIFKKVKKILNRNKTRKFSEGRIFNMLNIIWIEINNIVIKLNNIAEKNKLNQEKTFNLFSEDKEFNEYIENINISFFNLFIKDNNNNNELSNLFERASYEFMLYQFLTNHFRYKEDISSYLKHLYIFKKYIDVKKKESLYN